MSQNFDLHMPLLLTGMLYPQIHFTSGNNYSFSS